MDAKKPVFTLNFGGFPVFRNQSLSLFCKQCQEPIKIRACVIATGLQMILMEDTGFYY
jgi:hypothetical protein